MKSIEIRNLEELRSLDLSNYEVNENISIDIKLRLENEEIEYPINVYHKNPGLESNVNVKLALFGKSKVKMPVVIFVKEGAKETSTKFKANVLLMSPNSYANITPGLFIHEKNIQSAGHGVVIKNVKDKDLYYLRARGINKNDAREIIVGF